MILTTSHFDTRGLAFMKKLKKSIILIDILSLLLCIVGFVVGITIPVTDMGWFLWSQTSMLNVVATLKCVITVLFVISVLCTILLVVIKIGKLSFNDKTISIAKKVIVIFVVVSVVLAVALPLSNYSFEEYSSSDERFEIGYGVDEEYQKYFPFNSKIKKDAMGNSHFAYKNQSVFSTDFISISNFSTILVNEETEETEIPTVLIEYFRTDSDYLQAIYYAQTLMITHQLKEKDQQQKNGIDYYATGNKDEFYLAIINEEELFLVKINDFDIIDITEDEIIDSLLSVYKEVKTQLNG